MAVDNPLLIFDSPRQFVNAAGNGGDTVQAATTCKLDAGLKASRQPPNAQPGEAQWLALGLSDGVTEAIQTLPDVADNVQAILDVLTYNPSVPYVDGGIIVFDLGGAGGMTITTTASGGAPTISAINFTVGKTYRIDFLDLHGSTVSWNSMFVIAGGEQNSTSGAFPELLMTVWDCVQTPTDGVKLYQRSGKLFVGVS